MLGLIVLLVGVVYLAVSLWVIVSVFDWAGKNKQSAWWGVLAIFVMYNLVFWDWIPTVVMHKYYCSTQAGFWVYKTPEQWMKENPAVMETLVASKVSPLTRQGDMESYTDTYFLNNRFNWVVKRHGKFLFNRWLHEQTVVDTKTNEVLAKYVDFSTSQIAPQAGWNGWKAWLTNEHCDGGAVNQDALRNYRNNFMGIEK